ncbi:MAG: hypothetical protein ABR566_03825 [Pyrinomonadaceae bacterium]
MRKISLLLSLFVLVASAFISVRAQVADSGIKPNLAAGEVTSVTENKIVLQTRDGAIDVVLSTATQYKRVPADNPSLKAATSSSLTDIGIGDKLLVTGQVSADKKTFPAKAVYLMTKSDITQRQTKEHEEWKTRGISGRVASVNPQTSEITVSVRGITGERTTILKLKDKANFRRYAVDSVRFSEAKDSTFSEIKTGDMIRALGDKSEDGATFTAEKIVTGTFKTVGGTIKAIDMAKNEVVITDIQTKKDVTIAIGKNTTLKQFPAEMAQRMAQFQMMQAGGIQPGGQGGMRPPRQPQGGQPNQQGQMPERTGQGGGMRGGTIDDMLERFPNITITDLKVGEMIAVSSTKTTDADKITAIKLLSGIEPFLKVSQAQGQRQGNGQRTQDSGFNIPGLEGFGNP